MLGGFGTSTLQNHPSTNQITAAECSFTTLSDRASAQSAMQQADTRPNERALKINEILYPLQFPLRV